MDGKTVATEVASLPVRGAWVEIVNRHAVRLEYTSLPVRGAWVEMDGCGVQTKREKVSLPVRGAWVEIVQVAICCLCRLSRSPCGERGLK